MGCLGSVSARTDVGHGWALVRFGTSWVGHRGKKGQYMIPVLGLPTPPPPPSPSRNCVTVHTFLT